MVQDRKRVHFIGIGGIGVSSLARHFLANNWQVSGSDIAASEIIEELRREGVEIYIGHRPTNVASKTSLVIYSAAVPRNNAELKTARHLKIKILSYAEALGALTRKFFTVAVSGSHGKSTTTAMIGLILTRAGFDPTIIVGTKLKEFGNKNFRPGKSKYLVIEADEWNHSFNHYFPKIAVVTNIDKEHLDTYRTHSGVVAGFAKFFKNLPPDGYLIANWADPGVKKAAALAGGRVLGSKKFTIVWYNRKKFSKHPLPIPGRHNQENAEAAWQAVKLLGVRKSVADAAFGDYRGSWRRLEQLPATGFQFPATIYSDYAHHPTEIKATLAALRERHPRRRLVCVFQPHQEDRLIRLFNDFIPAFNEADFVILMPAYTVAGREERTGRDSFALAQKISHRQENVFYAPDLPAALKIIKKFLFGETVIVFMSAGDLDQEVRKRLDFGIS